MDKIKLLSDTLQRISSVSSATCTPYLHYHSLHSESNLNALLIQLCCQFLSSSDRKLTSEIS